MGRKRMTASRKSPQILPATMARGSRATQYKGKVRGGKGGGRENILF